MYVNNFEQDTWKNSPYPTYQYLNENRICWQKRQFGFRPKRTA